VITRQRRLIVVLAVLLLVALTGCGGGGGGSADAFCDEAQELVGRADPGGLAIAADGATDFIAVPGSSSEELIDAAPVDLRGEFETLEAASPDPTDEEAAAEESVNEFLRDQCDTASVQFSGPLLQLVCSESPTPAACSIRG
jgi:hypothetical protein